MFLTKQLISFLSLCFLTFSGFAQDSLGAVHDWKVISKKIGEGKFELNFSGTISGDWQLYTPNQTLLEVKTTELKFADSSIIQEGDFTEVGSSKEINSIIFEATKVKVQEGNVLWKAVIAIAGPIPAQLQGSLFYTYGKNDEFYPSTSYSFDVSLEGGVQSTTTIKVASIDINKPVNNCGDDGTKGKSIFSIFLLGVLGGLIALLTPCVFPMIPVTVTFFTKKSQDRKKGIFNAVMYGLFIFLIYTLITVPFHFVDSAKSEVFNNISTNVWLNIFFFAIFVFFALSFFGLFEITLPSGIANRADSKSGLGNLGGIFFMAATLTIVSFSCTGPILGTLLVGASSEGAWPLTAGAAGFGLALSLPFALFAMFPNWLQSLPKSGGWMTTVKVVLGFIELALAVKFLANADNVKQWGFMKREIFIGLWVVIGLLTTLYLAGAFRKKGMPGQKFSLLRILFIALFGALTLYLIPGLTNTKFANLKLLSGFPPPVSYSIYPHHVLHAKGVKPLVNDLAGALEKGRVENKPVLIDFTGWACVNCRRMEEKVWTNHVVDSLMRTAFVVVSLYVDERRKLPLTERISFTTSSGQEENIVTVGDKWTAFQKENFGAVSQPQYAILSAEQVALTKTKFYTPNAAEFIKWLECGLDAFKKTKK
ncbi:MAG: cytochrome c biogenesis protein CcdA [Bacteroidota bacterium]|nr:cytochrome c biogenesis protein CcdA [Bacteroidota bacterium]